MAILRRIFVLIFIAILTQINIGKSDFLLDDVLFRLKWVEKPQSLVEELSEESSVVMTTSDKEQYRCFFPKTGNDEMKNTAYSGPSAKIVLKPLFKQQICVYKIEPYWTYEMCHGKHLRQYHEEKLPGNEIKLVEYFLGRYEAPAITESVPKSIPTKKIDGKDMPYYEVLFSNGTLCDIKPKKARLTRLRYVCDPLARNELANIEEVSTCEYEGLVLSPTLCSHPQYKIKEVPENHIKCQPLAGSPIKPAGFKRLNDANSQNQYSPITPPKESTTKRTTEEMPATVQPLPKIDTSVLKAFFKGEYCLSGGGGRSWWMYTFCYGKFVQQYHEERTGVRSSTITLGTWNTVEHIKWYHSSKRLKTQNPAIISQFYGNGDICDLTGKARQVQVRLKCKETLKLPAVSLSLQEPLTCDYILTIESSIFCPLLSTVDVNGLFNYSP
ncbi:endoplasmic reticulum lectin 1-like [Antedon mediterranea]|uniref:endoplasmic reticulum lectin 1-like n=1 Tax=Antedon mediterranea TaxID=105859 RepID=UPI003AF96282